MSPYRGFDYRIEDGVGTVTFARPEKLNSLTFEVYAELERVGVVCQTDEAVRVLVLIGAGKGFCSGGDVHEIIGELFKRDVKGMLQFTRMLLCCALRLARRLVRFEGPGRRPAFRAPARDPAAA